MMSNPTKDGKIPAHIQKQMMECVMKEWMKDGNGLRMFDSWEKAGYPNAQQVNEIVW